MFLNCTCLHGIAGNKGNRVYQKNKKAVMLYQKKQKAFVKIREDSVAMYSIAGLIIYVSLNHKENKVKRRHQAC
jgi:hypothetical protein